ncbi:EAL and HDOD domain-containing protein [Chromobacterium amazonense]|uniref:HDOD domain-containing protein n=1 Tax=Chromobacterium amazonense TaxID=1382803 RepID=A0ABU8V215_9NEIS|nr:HDOD domain-containing protein [Chromobacterium amazonense]MDE1714840.1 HDOD domain-containing protein [Chromobacterium amazonense]MDQ4542755.1 HDOD domain-containing protein [Chromobacterium amazonense]OHX18824.1 competence protein [Chromobacterium amazonense]
MLKSLIDGLTGRLKKTTVEETRPPASPDMPDTTMLELPPELPAEELPATLGFVSHQPVMDKQRRVVAYDFFVRQGKRNIEAGKQQEFDRLLLSTLHNMDIFRLLAYRRAFVHIAMTSLDEPLLRSMPAGSVIFVLEAVPGMEVSEFMLGQLDDLQKLGLRFALEPAAYDQTILAPGLQADLFGRMDYMVLDFAGPSTRVLAPILDQLPKRYPAVRWIARNVGTAEDLDVCLRAPGHNRFALFHGPFVSTAHSLEGGKVDNSQTRVLQIMRLLRANAEAKEVEAQFKLDSVLLFKLLRFINSPIHGLARKVQTIEETLLLLGRETMFKWLSMLLFTSRKDDGNAIALLEKSLIRARFLEKLGSYRGNKLEAEHLFLTGMFSLLDVLLNIPFPDVLDPLELPLTVREAVIEQKGIFAPHLALALACEHGDNVQIEAQAKVLNLDIDLVNQYYLDSVVWAQVVLRDSEVHNNVEAV